MKVLVTGGAGKLGRFVLQDLRDQGHDAYCVDRAHPTPHRYGHSILAELTDTAALFDVFLKVKPEGVVHLAANPSPHGHPRHAQFMQNVGMTHAVLQVCGDMGVKRVAFASSEMANGWSSRYVCPPVLPFNEAHVITTPNPYALSKVVGEQIAESMQAAYPEMAIASLRVNLVTHPDWEYFYRNLDRFPGHHPNLWGYQDARDAASACRLWLESNLAGHRTYMLAAEDSLIDLPIREAIRRQFGEDITVGESVGEYGSLVDCQKIRDELGWKPAHSWRDEPVS